MITGTQIRAARYLVGISIEHLAESTGVAVATIRLAEGGEAELTATAVQLSAIRSALEDRGVEFLDDGTNVRFSCGR